MWGDTFPSSPTDSRNAEGTTVLTGENRLIFHACPNELIRLVKQIEFGSSLNLNSATRQTELEESFPSHVVCKWIGNSLQVARKHYLQTTDEHFDRAIWGGAKSGARVVQNQAQHRHALDRTDSQNGVAEQGESLATNELMRSIAKPRDTLPNKMAEVHGNRTHRRHG